MVTIHADHVETTTETEDTRGIIARKHKCWQVMKMCVIVVLTVLCIVFLVFDLVITAKTVKEQRELNRYIQASGKVSSVIETLQEERSISVFHLVSVFWNMTTQSEHKLKLQNIRNITDAKIKNLRHKWQFTLTVSNGNVITDFVSFVHHIDILRSKINNETDQCRLRYYFDVYSNWINELILWLVNDPNTHNHADHSSDLAACHMIVKSREEFEKEKAFGTLYFYYGRNFSSQTISSYKEKRVRAEAFLETAQLLSSSVRSNYRSLKNEINTSLSLRNLESKRQILKSNSAVRHSSRKDAAEWFELMTTYTKLLVRLEVDESRRTTHHIEITVNHHTVWLILRSLLVCLVVILVPFFIISLMRVQNEMYKYAHALHHKVGLEQSRTEFLLKENSRHMEGLAARWKQFSQQSNAEKQIEVQPQPGVPK